MEFNPVAENVVMTTNADYSVQLCDVTAGGDSAVCTVDAHTNSINRSVKLSGIDSSPPPPRPNEFPQDGWLSEELDK